MECKYNNVTIILSEDVIYVENKITNLNLLHVTCLFLNAFRENVINYMLYESCIYC